MKVNAITYRNYPKQQAFHGLPKIVKKVENNTSYEPFYNTWIGTYTVRKTIYYYPYADETQTEIDSFIKVNTSKIESKPLSPYLSDQTTKITETSVKVQPRLPFTRQDYRDYVEDMQINEDVFEENKDIQREELIKLLVSKKSIQTEQALIEAGLESWIA